MNTIIEHHKGNFLISTDKSRLDVAFVHEILSKHAYWALERPLPVVIKSIQNSLCFGLYAGEQQIGFARVVTDYATFGWLCDVIISDAYRGQNLGKWLVECIVAHPELCAMKRLILATGNAQELYRQYGGFENLPIPGKWMVRFNRSEIGD